MARLLAIALFIVTGLVELGGCYFVWQAVREKRPWWYALIGFALLCWYGVMSPLLQPRLFRFGHVNVAYGGMFTILAILSEYYIDRSYVTTQGWIGFLVIMLGVIIFITSPVQ